MKSIKRSVYYIAGYAVTSWVRILLHYSFHYISVPQYRRSNGGNVVGGD
jgi:hypothetical protein